MVEEEPYLHKEMPLDKKIFKVESSAKFKDYLRELDVIESGYEAQLRTVLELKEIPLPSAE